MAKLTRCIGTDIGGTNVRWAKGLTDMDRILPTERHETLALSAFHLSSLPTDIARKEVVKQMWESGADVIVCHCLLLDFPSFILASRFSLITARKKALNQSPKRESIFLELAEESLMRPKLWTTIPVVVDVMSSRRYVL